MKYYTVELTTPKLDHIVIYNVKVGSFAEAEKAAHDEYDWAKPLTMKSIRLDENPNAKYEEKLKYIPLTGHQASLLTAFLSLSTEYRNREYSAWESLSKEVEPDGVTPAYKNAASNAAFWADMICQLDEIHDTILKA